MEQVCINVEQRIRDAMREFDLPCPVCGSYGTVVQRFKDTDVGIMDKVRCEECDADWTMVSSVHTYIVL